MLSQRAPLPDISKKEKKRKENQLSDLQVQNGSHRLTFSELLWLMLSFHGSGKEHSSGTDAVWCDPVGAGVDPTVPCLRSVSLHSCPVHPPGPRTPRGATGAPRSLPPPLWAPPRWRADGPSVCSSGRSLTGQGRSEIKAENPIRYTCRTEPPLYTRDRATPLGYWGAAGGILQSIRQEPGNKLWGNKGNPD